MKVLVVGGAGYIGGAVTDVLQERNIPFSIYDNLLYETHYLKPVDLIHGDVRDRDKLSRLLPAYSHVVWLAAIVGDAACQIRPDLTIAVNQEAPGWLSKNFDGRIVFASTCSVYGQNDKELDENSETNPLSLYAKTKIEAEKLFKDKNAVVLRLGTVYGVGDMHSRLRMDLVVNYMTARAHTHGKLQVYGGAQWRPLMHVYNVAEAIVNALEKGEPGVYNAKTANYQMKDLGAEIARITGCELELVEQKFEDQRNYRVNSDKASRAGLLHFKQVHEVPHGVKQIHDLVKTGRIKYTDNDVYFNERHIANLAKSGEI